MKVTKNVEAYVSKVVREKIEVRYAEKLREQHELRERREAVSHQIEEEVKTYLKTLEVRYQEDHLKFNINRRSNALFYDIKDCLDFLKDDETKKILNASCDMNKEISDISMEILATLELGGNKEDLDRMVREI